MTRVLIVDDHALVAETLAAALTTDEITVTAVNATTDDPAHALTGERYDFCLLDLDWGEEGMRGVSMIRPLRRAGTECLILTGTVHEPLFGYCLELGAAGIITKTATFPELVESVQRAMAGESPNSDAEKYRWMMAAHEARERHRGRLGPFDALTAAEQEVLLELMNGHGAADIAERRTVALSTVRSQVRQILQKLGARSQLAAVAMARDAGWPGMGFLDTDDAPALSSVLPQTRSA